LHPKLSRTLELEGANRHTLDKGTVTFVVPDKIAAEKQCRDEVRLSGTVQAAVRVGDNTLVKLVNA
jgi:hypothetical protein